MSSFKEQYNYAIDVQPVDSCPNNESEWQVAAARTGCNGTRGYHCVPDKFHSRLIEFCYNKTRILVPTGKVLFKLYNICCFYYIIMKKIQILKKS